MTRTEIGHSNEVHLLGKSLELADDSDDEMTPQDKEIVETARRWGQAITAADHKAIYESSARDITGWLDSQDRSQISQ